MNYNHKLGNYVVSSQNELIQYVVSSCSDVRNCSHKLNSCVVSLPHELTWYVEHCWLKLVLNEQLKSQIEHLCGLFASWTDTICFFKVLFLNNYNHKLNTCGVSFPHEPFQCVVSNFLFVNNCNHKMSTWVLFFSHECFRNVVSICYSMDNCIHKLNICVVFSPHALTDSIWLFKLLLYEHL
jgi:hypothetical protein